MADALVVSLHDVSPHTWPACERILAELLALGVGKTSLLVIPDHHRRGHFLDRPDFCEWLRRLVSEGHEVVMHGYYHQREARAGETMRDRATTQLYTAGEGEFFDLDQAQARELVSRAREEFQRAGFSPAGFIAPAWLLSDEAEAALRELDIAYTTRLRTVTDLSTGVVHPSQSLCWSVRAAWRRVMSLAWNAVLFRRLKSAPLIRVAIHPVDIAHSRVWRQICRVTSAALRKRRAVTYAEWVSTKHQSIDESS